MSIRKFNTPNHFLNCEKILPVLFLFIGLPNFRKRAALISPQTFLRKWRHLSSSSEVKSLKYIVVQRKTINKENTEITYLFIYLYEQKEKISCAVHFSRT